MVHKIKRPPTEHDDYWEIPLTRGLMAIVCKCHFHLVKEQNWRAFTDPKGTPYASTRMGRNPVFFMHRAVFGQSDLQIDHIDGNGLNNRCDNLRACTRSQNQMNTKRRVSKTGHRGVYAQGNGYEVHICMDGHSTYGGWRRTLEDAIELRKKLVTEHYGEFAHASNFE